MVTQTPKTVKKPSAQSGQHKSSGRNDLTFFMLHGNDKSHDISKHGLMTQTKCMRGMHDSSRETNRVKSRREIRYNNGYLRSPTGNANSEEFFQTTVTTHC